MAEISPGLYMEPGFFFKAGRWVVPAGTHVRGVGVTPRGGVPGDSINRGQKFQQKGPKPRT